MQQVIFKKQLDFMLLVVKRETEEKKKGVFGVIDT